VWLRHTVLKAPGGLPCGSLWLTVFDRAAPAPVALKATHRDGELSVGDGTYIKIGEAMLAPGIASGRLDAGERGQASWELSFDEGPPPFRYLPGARMYEAPVPRTKALSLYPSARFTGVVAIGHRALELQAWPGMIGHNWGREHAYRSSWLHATAFAEQPEAYLDAVVARIKLGPVVTPWVGNGCLWLDGRLHRLGGVRPWATSFDGSETSARFELRGGDVEVAGEVTAPAAQFVAWRYGHPDGGWHPTMNCSVADMRLRVRATSGAERTLSASATAAYEVQLGRDAELPVPLQPFGDP
jgi:hypothetical protein